MTNPYRCWLSLHEKGPNHPLKGTINSLVVHDIAVQHSLKI